MSKNAPATRFVCTPELVAWLRAEQASLAFTTLSGNLFLIGLRASGALGAAEFSAKGTQGLWVEPERLWLAAHAEVYRFDHVTSARAVANGYDRLFVPRLAHVTGPVDAHDVVVDGDGRVILVSTAYNCLATLSPERGIEPLWKPPFISRIAPEDRCHLNGLALRDGVPAFVTTCSRSDVVDGWRDRRVDGGCVVDVASGEIVARGLSMPHSPRWYQGKLWLLNGGAGYFGYLDLASGRFEPVVFLPGFARGLAFSGDYAVVGVSKPRHDRTFGGLPLTQNLERHDAEPRCGLHVIDLRSGVVRAWLRFEGEISELYDVVTLPGVKNPTVLPPDGAEFDEVAAPSLLEHAP